VMVVMEQTVPLEVGLRFENRVHLRENVVFSWSYQKLSSTNNGCPCIAIALFRASFCSQASACMGLGR